MKPGLLLLLPILTLADPDPDRNGKRGFRERIRCIDNGKFYRNPNTPRDLAFRKVNSQIMYYMYMMCIIKYNLQKECAEYYLCIEGEVFPFKCSTGLTFDIKRQICDR